MLTKAFVLLAVNLALATAGSADSPVALEKKDYAPIMPIVADTNAFAYKQWDPSQKHEKAHAAGPSQWHHHPGPSQWHHGHDGHDGEGSKNTGKPTPPSKPEYTKGQITPNVPSGRITPNAPVVTDKLTHSRGAHETHDLSSGRGDHAKPTGKPGHKDDKDCDDKDKTKHWGPSQSHHHSSHHHSHSASSHSWGPSQLHQWQYPKPTNKDGEHGHDDEHHDGKDWDHHDDGKGHYSGGSKDHGKDHDGKDWGKDHNGKDSNKDHGKDHGKDGGKDWNKDGGKDHGKDGGKDHGKDGGKGDDHGSDSPQPWASASARARIASKHNDSLYALYGQAAADVCNLESQMPGAEITACPLDNGASGWDCLNLASTLESCGGCMSIGEGQDCTLIKGAETVGCIHGKCVIGTCEEGYYLDSSKGECVAN